jgi:hypothetical protein
MESTKPQAGKSTTDVKD